MAWILSRLKLSMGLSKVSSLEPVRRGLGITEMAAIPRLVKSKSVLNPYPSCWTNSFGRAFATWTSWRVHWTAPGSSGRGASVRGGQGAQMARGRRSIPEDRWPACLPDKGITTLLVAQKSVPSMTNGGGSWECGPLKQEIPILGSQAAPRSSRGLMLMWLCFKRRGSLTRSGSRLPPTRPEDLDGTRCSPLHSKPVDT